MLKVIDFAREKGMEEGLERGLERGLEKGKYDILLLLLTKKFKKIPEEYKENLAKLDSITLNTLASDIFDMQDIKELEKYFFFGLGEDALTTSR